VRPSPALMIEHFKCCESNSGVPGVGWRTTTTSAPIASMFLAVSMNDSPFDRLEPLGEKSWVSAESRLAARLKLVRVRVEFSKNKLKTIRPVSAGTFLRLRVEISANDSDRVENGQNLFGRKLLRPSKVPPAKSRAVFSAPQRRPRHVVLLWDDFVGGILRDLDDLFDAINGRQPYPHVFETIVGTAKPTTSGWIGSSR